MLALADLLDRESPALERAREPAKARSVIWLVPGEKRDRVSTGHTMKAGTAMSDAPSIGAWVVHALRRENQNLPGYVVLDNQQAAERGALSGRAGFLPAACQATSFRTDDDSPRTLRRPRNISVSKVDKQAQRDLIKRLGDRTPMHPSASIELSRESAAMRALYGLDDRSSRRFGTQCLLARRLVQRGVRFVQVHLDPAGNPSRLGQPAGAPIDGLLTDLKRRGLLASTLVIWGGELARDHTGHGPLAWMTGAGILGGGGETDKISWKAVVDSASIHDLHATVLHLLGIDHRRLVCSRNGRRHRLSDAAGNVLTQILA